MEIKDFEPNTHKYREAQKEERRVQKVVDGPVKTKKKSEATKFVETFISEDVHKVKEYIWLDVLVPAVKKAISDIVTNGIDMLLYGETGRSRRKTNASVVSYRNYYDSRREERYSSSRTRTGYSYDDVVLETRGEAEDVLSRMDELIDTYGVVSVADLYDLVGISCNYTDNKYGWTNLRNAEPVRVRDGYMLKLPKALPID